MIKVYRDLYCFGYRQLGIGWLGIRGPGGRGVNTGAEQGLSEVGFTAERKEERSHVERWEREKVYRDLYCFGYRQLGIGWLGIRGPGGRGVNTGAEQGLSEVGFTTERKEERSHVERWERENTGAEQGLSDVGFTAERKEERSHMERWERENNGII